MTKLHTQWVNSFQISTLKKTLREKDEHYHQEMITQQSNTDRDIMELRRLMDKIDMSHHENFEKLVQSHEEEIGELPQRNSSNG